MKLTWCLKAQYTITFVYNSYVYIYPQKGKFQLMLAFPNRKKAIKVKKWSSTNQRTQWATMELCKQLSILLYFGSNLKTINAILAIYAECQKCSLPSTYVCRSHSLKIRKTHEICKYLIKKIATLKKNTYFKTDVARNMTSPTVSLCFNHRYLCAHIHILLSWRDRLH